MDLWFSPPKTKICIDFLYIVWIKPYEPFKVHYKKEQYSYKTKIDKDLNWEVKILVKLPVISFQCFNNIFTNYTHLWKHVTNQNGIFHKGKSLLN